MELFIYFGVRSYKELVQQHQPTSKIVGGASYPALNAFTVIALRFYMSLSF